MKDKQESQERMLKDFIDSADTKYANKNVERLVYGMIAIVLTAFIYAIVYIVIPGS